MRANLNNLRHSMVSKLIFSVGIILLLSIATWAYFNIKYQKQKVMEDLVKGSDRLSNTIMLGTHYAMTLNSRDDINQIINNIGRQKEIENIRIYNKSGQIKFSNHAPEVDRITNIKAEACDICHRSDPPLSKLDLSDRIRIFASADGTRRLGIISPICNEPGCATEACHMHPSGKKILGALDLVFSLADSDKEVLRYERGIIAMAVFVFLITSAIIFVFLLRFVNRPISKLIEGTQKLARGEDFSPEGINPNDEMGQLAKAIDKMGREIGEKQAELNKQKNEYQNLFESVPCIITVQNKDYKLVNYNRQFAEKFDPNLGDHCYRAYKGRDQKCEICPVENTFSDGQPHYGEMRGRNKDGSDAYWLVRTSPVRNSAGDIVAAMEMSLDITERRLLEKELAKSEKKYHEIFNNIPNPVFVLDKNTLEILDCNQSVQAVYGWQRHHILNRTFLELIRDEKELYAGKIKSSTVINQVRQINKAGQTLFVDIWVSPSEYLDREVLLVTTSDITQRLEAEQQLIQASKMATLGEMATGVAHELNQPLSVIKTASSFCRRKADKKERVQDEILFTMLTKIDNNVDRATRIVNHMREFARKSDGELGQVRINEVLEKAFEIFSQQLKVRGIEVVWNLAQNLPVITGDPGRLEQVFINLLLNARDAIEERWGSREPDKDGKKITLKTQLENGQVIVKVMDSGVGIPKAVADKIFEPFFTTKEVGKGTGLGLSISYGIVKECGGTISAQSETNRGTCFTLTFPVQNMHDGKISYPKRHFAGG